MKHNFENLSPSEFEDLARDIVSQEIGARLEAFSDGPDGGIDGRTQALGRNTILQVKHFARSPFSALKSSIKTERKKVDRLSPDRYILVTSLRLSPKKKDELHRLLGSHVLSPEDILGAEDLNSLLRKYPEIERAHPKLWMPTAVAFQEIVQELVKSALGDLKPSDIQKSLALSAPEQLREHAQRVVEERTGSAHLSLKFNQSVYVSRLLEDDVIDWLSKPPSKVSTCFLILAPAGSGKTNLLCSLAEASSKARPTVLLVGAQLRIGGVAGLWPSVLEAMGIVGLSDLDRAQYVLVAKRVAETADGCSVVLDAINEYSDPVALKRELSIFLEECESAGVHVLVSCRDYYWGLFDADWWSAYLKTSRSEKKETKRTLANFSPDESAEAFRLYFESYDISAQPRGNALEQLRHPLLLRFFCETYRGEKLGRVTDIRLKDLFDTYWERKLTSVAERMIDQGQLAIKRELVRHIGVCILDVSNHMLMNNVRAIPATEARVLMRSQADPTGLTESYGRILDEHIVLEELDDKHVGGIPKIAFVFEEFMEYAMARSLIAEWTDVTEQEVLQRVIDLTERYNEFSQVLGVILYLAIMLKEEHEIALWPTLIAQGERWQIVIIEALKKLPEDQVDDGVFAALVDLLNTSYESTQIAALELLKYGRLRRVPPPSLIESVGNLVTHSDLRIRRRAILALGFCPEEFALPLIQKAVCTPISRKTDAYLVIKNSIKSLVRFTPSEAAPILALIFGGYWHADHNKHMVASFVHENFERVCRLLHHDNLFVRLGAIRMLESAPSNEAVSVLSDLIEANTGKPRSWRLEEVPDWVKASGSFSLIGLIEIGERDWSTQPEVTAAGSVIRSLEMQLRWIEEDQHLHKKIDQVMLRAAPTELTDLIAGLKYDDDAIVKLMQGGLDKRDPKKWRVKRSRYGIRISPRSRKADKKAAMNELASLLALEEIRNPHQGYFQINTHWDQGRGRSYALRCWGIEPR